MVFTRVARKGTVPELLKVTENDTGTESTSSRIVVGSSKTSAAVFVFFVCFCQRFKKIYLKKKKEEIKIKIKIKIKYKIT